MSRIDGYLYVESLEAGSFSVPAGSIANSHISATAAIARSKLAQDALSKYVVPLHTLRVHDALATFLPTTSANDDLGLIPGTFGTSSPSIQTGDLKAAGATTRYGRFLFQLPPEYDNGESVSIRAHAGMLTTVSDGTATIDFECYASDKEVGVSADLVTTTATTINNLTLADKDFTVTAGSLVRGDWLDIRVAIAINDGSTPTAVIGCIGSLEVLLDIRG